VAIITMKRGSLAIGELHFGDEIQRSQAPKNFYHYTISRGYYTGIMSNLTRIDGTSTINAIAKGNIPVHLKYIS
jgi:hypothetical protein